MRRPDRVVDQVRRAGQEALRKEREVRGIMGQLTGYELIRPTWRHAGVIAEWALAQEHSDLELAGAQPFAVTVISSWWNRQGVEPVLLVDQSREPIAYGEVWDNPEEDESELAHLLISPQRHSDDVFRRLIDGLVGRARKDGRARCILRVPAGSCDLVQTSRAIGFRDVDQTTAAAWNREQARPYQWLEHPGFSFPRTIAQ